MVEKGKPAAKGSAESGEEHPHIMKFALTNDDGIDAPGLATLESVCRRLGSVVTVAPSEVQSGSGHRVTIDKPLRFYERGGDRYSVDGFPPDCARLALAHFATDADWLISGINQGANLGVDTYMSGTAAAAREAVIHGRPAMAISQYIGRGKELDWELTARRAGMVIETLLSEPPPDEAFWSINIPNPDSQEVNLELVYCELDPSPHGNEYELAGDRFLYQDSYHDRARVSGKDIDVCMSGKISITRLPVAP